VNKYKKAKSPLYIASLDAEKAYDSLWRMGLFHKLKEKMDENLWLILISYYEKSDGILEINNKIMNQIISINSGVKQGGLLSPLLFNYFINKLLMKKVEVSLVMLKRRY
jgi:retron-type reverse transcriptase